MQAKERAWRVGQLRSVAVYRLVTANTLEEVNQAALSTGRWQVKVEYDSGISWDVFRIIPLTTKLITTRDLVH